MFKIVCLVEDKHLPKVLHAMAGLVVNMEPPQPVINAVVNKGQIVQATTATSFKGQLIEELKKKSGSLISTKAMKDFFISIGANPNSINSTLTNQLIEEKVLKRKDRGLFVITVS